MTTTARSLRPRAGGDKDTPASLVGRVPDFIRASALSVAVAAVVLWVGMDGGGYALESRNTLAIIAGWALVLGAGLMIWPLARVPRVAWIAGCFLAGFTAFAGLSVLWATSAEKAFNDFNRAGLYLVVFVLVLAASTRGRARAWATGLMLGVTAISLVALASRLFPGLAAQTAQLAQTFEVSERRLSYPVNYWNALGTLAAFAIPLLLSHATARRFWLGRGAALAAIPALVATIYFTSSRGAFITAAIAAIAFVAFTTRRLAAALALFVASAGSAFALAVVRARPELVNDPVTSAAAEGQGRSAALLIALICLGTGGVCALAARFGPPVPVLPRLANWALVGVAVVGVVTALVAIDPVRRFEAFTETPTFGTDATIESHLFSTSGNGRWQLWGAAVDEFQTEPLVGRGAGSYEAWWAEHGTVRIFVRDAHSLYLETLGELGIVGLTLLLGFFGAVGFAAARRLRETDADDRPVVAALAAVLLGYAFEAGVDWMWEMTVVSLVAIIAAAVVAGPASVPGAERRSFALRRPRRRLLSAATTIVGVAFLFGQAIPLLANLKIEQSREAVSAGRLDEALDDAFAARELQPWAASPHLQVALVAETAGELEPARAAIRRAIERDRSDWRLWLIAARLETKAGQFLEARRSLDRARALNPRSPLFADLPS